MGGGSSVLSPELSESLTQPSLEEFHRLQLECEEKHMTPVEMYLYLSKKYEDLIRAEKQAVKEIQTVMKHESTGKKTHPLSAGSSGGHHHPGNESTKGHTEVRRRSLRGTDGIAEDQTAQVRRGSLKGSSAVAGGTGTGSSGGTGGVSTNTSTANSAGTTPHRQRSIADQIEEETLQQDIQFALACLDHESDSDDDNDVDKKDRIEFDPIHDPYVESVVGKVFQVNDTSSSKSHPQLKQLLHTLLPSSSTTNAILAGHPPTGHNASSGQGGLHHSPRFAAVVTAARAAANGTGHLPTPSSARNSARSDHENNHSAMNSARKSEEHNQSHGSLHNHHDPPPSAKLSTKVPPTPTAEDPSANKTSTDFVINNSIIHHDLMTGIFTCQVCQMDFDSRNNLDIHLSHSSLHAMNLRIRQDIFNGTVQEAERLAALAKMALGKFIPTPSSVAETASTRTTTTKSPPTSASIKANTTTNNNKSNKHKSIPYIYTKQYDIHHRWKRAINRVIATRLKQQFLPIVEQLFSTPPGIRLLHAGEKYFYQAKAAFDIHIYLHVAIDLVEIVIHTLPSKKIQAKQKKKALQQSSSPHSPTQTTSIDASFASYINPLNRIYLDYTVLVPLVLGVDKSESTLQEVEAANNAFLGEDDSSKLPAGFPTVVSNQFVSGVTSRIAAINSTSNDRQETMKLNKTIEQAVTSFVLNRLRGVTDDSSGHHSKKVTKIVLDVSTFAHSPVVEESRLKDHYAVKQQMHNNTLANTEMDQLEHIQQRNLEFKAVPVNLEVLRKQYESKFLKEIAEQQQLQQLKASTSPSEQVDLEDVKS